MRDKKDDNNPLFPLEIHPFFPLNRPLIKSSNATTGSIVFGGSPPNITVSFTGVIDPDVLNSDVNKTAIYKNYLYSLLHSAGYDVPSTLDNPSFTYFLLGPGETISFTDNTSLQVPLLLVGNNQNITTIQIDNIITINKQIFQADDHPGAFVFNIASGGSLTLNNACLLTHVTFNINGDFIFNGQFLSTTYDIDLTGGEKKTYTISNKDVTYDNGTNHSHNMLGLKQCVLNITGHLTVSDSNTLIFIDNNSIITLNTGATLNGTLIAGWNNNTYNIKGIFSIGSGSQFILSGSLNFDSTNGFGGNGSLVVTGDYLDGTGIHNSSVSVTGSATLGNLYIGYSPFYNQGFGGYDDGTTNPNGGTLTITGMSNKHVTLNGTIFVKGTEDHPSTVSLENGVIIVTNFPKTQGITIQDCTTFTSSDNCVLYGTLDIEGGTVNLGNTNQITYLTSEGGMLTDNGDNFTTANINESGGKLKFNNLRINDFTGQGVSCGISVSGGHLIVQNFDNSGSGNWHLIITGNGSVNINTNQTETTKRTITEIDISSSGSNTFTNLITPKLYLQSGNSGTTELVSGTYNTIVADAGILNIDANVGLTNLNLGESDITGNGATVNLKGQISFNDLEAYYGTLNATGQTTINTIHEYNGNLEFEKLTVNAGSDNFIISGGMLTVTSDLEYQGTLKIQSSGNAVIKGGNVTEIDISSSGSNTFTNLITPKLYLKSGNSGTTELVSGTYNTIVADAGILNIDANVGLTNLNLGESDITGNGATVNLKGQISFNDLEAYYGTLNATGQTTINTIHEYNGNLEFEKLTVNAGNDNFIISGGMLTVTSDLEYQGTLKMQGSAGLTVGNGNVTEIDLESGYTGIVQLKGGTYGTLDIQDGTLNTTGNITVNSLNYTSGFLEITGGGTFTFTGNQMNTPTSKEANQSFTLNDGTLILNPTLSGTVDMTGFLYIQKGGGKIVLKNNTHLTINSGLSMDEGGNLEIFGKGSVSIGNLLQTSGTQIILNSGIELIVNLIDSETFLMSSPNFLLKDGSILTFQGSFADPGSFNPEFETITFNPNNNGAEIKLNTPKITSYDEFHISGFNKQDKIDLEGIDFNVCTDFKISYSNGKLTIQYTDKNNIQHEIDFNNFTTDGTVNFIAESDNNGGTMILGCFLPGSQILTALGYRAVEHLKVGDAIHTFANGASTLEPIEWIGKTRCHVRPDLPADFAGVPVRVMKDAIAPNVPFEDLTLTSEHCLCLDNQFIPVRMLVNGSSIVYDHSLTSYDYYHIETKTHTIISANGLLTETYLDTGNRKLFEESSGAQLPDIYPVKTWDEAAAPLTTQPEIVEPIFNALKQRAHQLGFESHYVAPLLIEDPDLRIITDKGVTLFPSTIAGNMYTFTLPSNVGHIRIQSRSSRPCDMVGPYLDDRRSLGVLIGSIILTTKGHSKALQHHLEEPVLLGWHEIENTRCRWTNGNATLSLQGFTSGHEGSVSFELLSKGPYLLTKSERLKKTS